MALKGERKMVWAWFVLVIVLIIEAITLGYQVLKHKNWTYAFRIGETIGLGIEWVFRPQALINISGFIRFVQ